MKLQNLGVIFIIIILPISMILNAYVGNQVKTLSLQASYDTKLNNATYDALKAFQLNTINSDTSDLANSKLRDIEASANTFFNSIASNFNMVGYNRDILADYVPALVYTMYDGYYIYSPYTNTLDNTNSNDIENPITGAIEMGPSDAQILNPDNPEAVDATYKEGDKLSGVKPYIFYSCRYIRGSDDFVITYSLDNYITIQGVINNGWVNDAGYLLDNIGTDGSTYRGITIDSDISNMASEQVYVPGATGENPREYPYIRLNGVKYYYDKESKSWFSIMNGEKYKQDNFEPKTTAARQYYKEAKEFTERVRNTYKLFDLKGTDAVDENGVKLGEKLGNYTIFTDSNNSIEDSNSNFNQQRLAVIRYSIEKNLSIAIANYNNGGNYDFQMPVLKENEWDKILNHVSIISFLQGLSIGGKIYNGHSIITNNKNQEVVNEESIYILTKDGRYHRANDRDIADDSVVEGIFNIDLERKSYTKDDGEYYFFPKYALNGGCYNCIVRQTSVDETENFYQYMAGKGNGKLAQAYFTALGRERYGMYKTYNNPDRVKEEWYKH